MADPRLIQEIIRQAPPRLRGLLMATALVESGGRLEAVGDRGRSHGPFQEYDLGRGAGIPVSGRRDPAGAVSRALRDFLSLEGRFGATPELAYRAQRPADHAGYVRKIGAAMGQAQALLGGGGAGGGFELNAPVQGGVAAGGGQVALPPDLVRRLARWQVESEQEALAGRDLPLPAGTLAALAAAKRAGGPSPSGAAPAPAYAAPGAAPGFGADPGGGYGWAHDFAKRFGLRVGSTLRDPAAQARIYAGSGKKAQFTSRHLTPGGAVDLTGTPAQMRAAAEAAYRSGQFAEVFFDPWGQFDNGVRSSRGIGGHGTHLHLSAGASLFR